MPATPGQTAALWLQMLASIFGELWKRLYYLLLFSGTPSKEKPLRLLFWLSDFGVLLECLYFYLFFCSRGFSEPSLAKCFSTCLFLNLILSLSELIVLQFRQRPQTWASARNSSGC